MVNETVVPDELTNVDEGKQSNVIQPSNLTHIFSRIIILTIP